MERHLNMQSEIQLLGQTVEEATANLDKFLDDAVLGGIQTVRVVHGKGTGALRGAHIPAGSVWRRGQRRDDRRIEISAIDLSPD